MSAEFQVDGFAELYKAMDKLSEEIGKGKTDKIWRQSMAYAMEPVLQDAKTFAPTNTGQMQSRIYMKVHRPQSRDKSSSTYNGEMYIARVSVSTLRDDSIQDFIVNKRGKLQSVLRNKRPVPVSQEFGNANTPSHPFMRPALENNIDRVKSRLGSALWQKITAFTKTKG